MNTDIMVSVVMQVYNHEEYIRQAIESVVSQKTDFKYELLIGEDKSTDGSLEIIREYEKKYPDIIRVFAREENIGAIKNGQNLRMNSKGKYLTHLEGDDYWKDELKLQKQIDFLEKNPEYIACAHRFHVVNRIGDIYEDRDFECQFKQENPYTKEDMEKGIMLSHLNTIVFRNIFIDEKINTDFWTEFHHVAGDYTLNAILILNGKMYCLPEYMSCYRKVIDVDANSFSALQERKNTRDLLFRSVVELEEILQQTYKVECIGRKKNTFASAVFKWYRSKSKQDFKVVCNIIKMSKQRVKYTGWFLYLIVCRSWKDITGRKNQRVKF